MRSKIVLDGRFRVFEDGRVNRIKDGLETPAAQTISGHGYLVVTYYERKSSGCAGKQKSVRVHRLVASAFIENPNDYPEVNHIDGNKTNNHVSNLEWVTPSMNSQHAYRTGLIDPMRNAAPCVDCGALTRSKLGLCTECQEKRIRARKREKRREANRNRYSNLFTERVHDRYLACASNGMLVTEIAAQFGVSRQAVSKSLLKTERRSRQRGNADESMVKT